MALCASLPPAIQLEPIVPGTQLAWDWLMWPGHWTLTAPFLLPHCCPQPYHCEFPKLCSYHHKSLDTTNPQAYPLLGTMKTEESCRPSLGMALGKQVTKEEPSDPTRGSFGQLKLHFGDCFYKISYLGLSPSASPFDLNPPALKFFAQMSSFQ